MKQFSTICFLMCFCLLKVSFLAAQNQSPRWQVKMNYIHALPVGKAAVNLNQASGIALEGIYKPSQSRFTYGFEWGMLEYGYHKERINYALNAQDYVETTLNVMNCQTFFNVLTQLDLSGSTKVNPYIQAKLGINYFWTPLRIDDPSSNDDCQNSLEKAILTKDILPSATLGMGVKADISSLFKCRRSGLVQLDLQTNYTHGSSFRHMNVHHAYIPVSTESAEKSGNTEANSRQEVTHEYYRANSYLSPLRMIDFRIGVSWAFN